MTSSAPRARAIPAEIIVTEIFVSNGVGVWSVTDYQELWHLMWKAVAFAMHGPCLCGCRDPVCLYCLHDCY